MQVKGKSHSWRNFDYRSKLNRQEPARYCQGCYKYIDKSDAHRTDCNSRYGHINRCSDCEKKKQAQRIVNAVVQEWIKAKHD